jgi:hypothetical protein
MKLDAKVPSGPIEKKWEKHRFENKLVNPANKRKVHVHHGRLGPGRRRRSRGRWRSSGTT